MNWLRLENASGVGVNQEYRESVERIEKDTLLESLAGRALRSDT
jgi:hypothetical protein